MEDLFGKIFKNFSTFVKDSRQNSGFHVYLCRVIHPKDFPKMSKKPDKSNDRHLGKLVAFHIPIEWLAALNIACIKENLNRAQMMRKVLRFYIEKKKHEHPKDTFGVDGN